MLSLFNLGRFKQEDSAYRRGMVLGFTMAEIAILIIFILLIAMGALLQKENAQKESWKKQAEDANQTVSALKDAYKDRLSGLNDVKFEEFVRELVLAEKRAAENNQLRKELAEKSELLIRIEKAMGEKPLDQIADALEEREELLKEIDKQGGIDAEKLIAELKEARREQRNLKGQNESMRRKIENLGKGTEHPPCWADVETGKPEYTFAIALHGRGLSVKPIHPDHRQEDVQHLPMSNLLKERVFDRSGFLDATRPLFQWSVKNECRFFVKVFDKTGPSEKLTYKNLLRTVEHHFYKFEPVDESY